MLRPELYFEENMGKTNRLLTQLVRLGVKQFVFSSTAAVYGNPKEVPIAEEAETRPVNPYGASKRMIEESLSWMEQAHGLKWIALRYFNAAGAALDGSSGEDHGTESHLIPLVLKTALGQRARISVFGTDYETADGTCIRDYVHVLDLAEAHAAALAALDQGMGSGIFNVGTGRGYSVREVIEKARLVTGREIAADEDKRRPGDPAILVAKVEKMKELLGWEPGHSDLETILASAWKWHQSHPDGYGD